MRVLVLGATGMLGHRLARDLSRHFDVIGAVRGLEAPPALAGLRIVRGLDAAEPDSVRALLREHAPAVVLNCVPARGSLATDAEDAIGHYGSAVCPIRVGHRAVFVHSLTEGLSAPEFEPGGKGDREIRQLYKWVCRQVGLRT